MDAKDPNNVKAIKEGGGRRNPQWKKRWGTIAKYDQDWDYRYLLDIILHKLYLMHERYAKPSMHVILADVERQRIADSIAATIEIGERVRKDEYGAEADAFLDAHTTREFDGNGAWRVTWDSEESKQTYRKMVFERDPAMKQNDIDAFFQSIAENLESWWD